MFITNIDPTVSSMGVWPLGAGLQGQAPNHPMPLRFKVVVVSDWEKAVLIRQVSDEEMSVSESLRTRPKGFHMQSKRLCSRNTRIECGRYLLTVHGAAGVPLRGSIQPQPIERVHEVYEHGSVTFIQPTVMIRVAPAQRPDALGDRHGPPAVVLLMICPPGWMGPTARRQCPDTSLAKGPNRCAEPVGYTVPDRLPC